MKKTQALLALAIVAAAATLTACSHAMMMIHGWLKAVESTRLEAFLNALSGPIVVNGLQGSVSTR